MSKKIVPDMNLGLVGHVDHGKTTLVKCLSGKWTDTHSEEIKRGITIRLGYANIAVYKCEKCDYLRYFTSEKCPKCGAKGKLVRAISLVDAPGHESLMATMLAGTTIMDGALLLIAADEPCPQPQTKEHLMALEIIGLDKVIVVQNKIDLISKEKAIENYKQIKEFLKGTKYENAPIIPVSARYNINIDLLLDAIIQNIEPPKRNLRLSPLMFAARSFDINKPGTKIDDLHGGVIGGALKQGTLKVGEEIEIRPGIKKSKKGRDAWHPLKTKITNIMTADTHLEKATPGGSIAIETELDPSYVKSDSLMGSVIGHIDKLPPVREELELEIKLLKRVVGSKEEIKVDPIKLGEPLMLNVNSAATVGSVISISKKGVKCRLKIPVCASEGSRITVSRIIGNRWRLIGYALIK